MASNTQPNVKKSVLDVKGKKMKQLDSKDLFTKPQKKTLKHSMFTFTFNTNYRPKSKPEIISMDERYTDLVDRALGNEETIRKSLKKIDSIEHRPYNNTRKAYATHVMTSREFDEDIKHVKARHHNEVGRNYKKGGRFHVHGYIYILHTTMVHLDINVLKDEINKLLEANGLPKICYAHMGYEKPGMKEYMKKQDYI